MKKNRISMEPQPAHLTEYDSLVHFPAFPTCKDIIPHDQVENNLAI